MIYDKSFLMKNFFRIHISKSIYYSMQKCAYLSNLLSLNLALKETYWTSLWFLVTRTCQRIEHQRRRRYDSIVTLLPKEDRRIKWPIVNCIAIFRKQIVVLCTRLLFYIHFLHRGIVYLGWGIGQNFTGPR